VPNDVADENQALQAEVIKLEGMVRERTEQLNKLRWQQDMIEKQGGGDASNSKMLVVLNQQLQSAREENQKLKDKVRALETAPPAVAVAPPEEAEEPDDLSSIKGIGPKLVKQLRKLGITRFDQIATLSEADLDDEKHPLHSVKGRVLKDNWIEQAAELGGIV
jgi:predicted flap endonuclease-1-like 5' DNA nuclease